MALAQIDCAYVDSSVIVSILLHDGRWHYWQRILQRCVECVSALLLEAEVYATAARESIPLEDAKAAVEAVSLIIPQRSFAPEYERIFAHGYCRGADAHHLATLLSLDPELEEIVLLSADTQQARLAARIGIAVHGQ